LKECSELSNIELWLGFCWFKEMIQRIPQFPRVLGCINYRLKIGVFARTGSV